MSVTSLACASLAPATFVQLNTGVRLQTSAVRKTRPLLGIAAVASVIGLYCFWVAGTYGYDYISEQENPYRDEYLVGVFLPLTFALPIWLLVSGLLYPIRRDLPQKLYWAWNAPAALLLVCGAGTALRTVFLLWRGHAT